MEQLQSQIWLTTSSYMGKYLRISSYIRKPFLIYDFATAPLWISLYMRKIWFSLSVYQGSIVTKFLNLRREFDVHYYWHFWNCIYLALNLPGKHFRKFKFNIARTKLQKGVSSFSSFCQLNTRTRQPVDRSCGRGYYLFLCWIFINPFWKYIFNKNEV